MAAAYLRRWALNSLTGQFRVTDRGEQVYLGQRKTLDGRPLMAGLVYFVMIVAHRRYPGLSHTVETDAERVVVRVAAPLDLPLPFPEWVTPLT
jgi:hypothetical protein